MQVTAIKTHTTGELKPFHFEEGEKILFKWNRNKKGDRVWFSGANNNIRNIYIGAVIVERLGKISEEDDKKIIQMMIKGKTDILTDGVDYYTRSGELAIIKNLETFSMKNGAKGILF